MFPIVIGIYSGLSSLGLLRICDHVGLPDMASGALSVGIPVILAVLASVWRYRL